MSHDEDFKDSTGVGTILFVIITILAVPLFPMLMGWFSLLR